MSRNPDSIVRLAFTISKYGGALPVTWFSSVVAVLMLIVNAVVFYMTTLTTAIAALTSEQTLIEKILTIIIVIGTLLLNLLLVQGFIAHKKQDIFRITRSIYRTHGEMCKLGLVPDYKWFLIGTSVSFCIIIPLVEITFLTVIGSGDEEVHRIYTGIYSRVSSRVTRHLYLAQALSLLGLSLDQLSCAIKALVHQNQWYLESLVTVQNHVLKNVKDTFAMFEGYLSFYVVLLSFASIIYAYRVYSIDGIWIILLCLEFIELILILGVFETITQVVSLKRTCVL